MLVVQVVSSLHQEGLVSKYAPITKAKYMEPLQYDRGSSMAIFIFPFVALD